MTIEEMDEAYSNLKTEYFDIQDKLTTARQCEDCYKRDILKLQKQLEIAKETLKKYAISDNYNFKNQCYPTVTNTDAMVALLKIEELEK